MVGPGRETGGPHKQYRVGDQEDGRERLECIYSSPLKLEAVRQLVSYLVGIRAFVPSDLRRGYMRQLAARRRATGEAGIFAHNKPHAGSVEEMASVRDFFRTGDALLPPGQHNLKPEVIERNHRRSCTECLSSNELCSRGCNLRDLVLYGWLPVLTKAPKKRREQTTNYPKIDIFPEPAKAAFEKAVECGSAVGFPGRNASMEVFSDITCIRSEMEEETDDGVVYRYFYDGLFHPLNVIFKKSDEHRVRIFTRQAAVPFLTWMAQQEDVETDTKVLAQRFLTVHEGNPSVAISMGETELLEANDQLLALGFSAVKGRIATDCTVSGLNEAAWVPSFSMSTPSDGFRLMTRNCFQIKADLENFFQTLPLAIKAWCLFSVLFFGAYWTFRNCCFGFAPTPFYASMWSAEIKRWITVILGIAIAHYVDDFIANGGQTRAEAEELADKIVNLVEEAGWKMPKIKLEIEQKLEFLGITCDSTTMRMSIDPVKAESMARVLSEHVKVLKNPRKNVPGGEINTIAGKLGFYSEVLHSGRLHSSMWWRYNKFRAALWPSAREVLVKDTEWWIKRFQTWADDRESGFELPIINSSELLTTPGLLWLLQSDSSGTDGFGYFYSSYAEKEGKATWYSQRWNTHYVNPGSNSHAGELYAVLHFLRVTTLREIMLLWITDSESGMWTLNTGVCVDSVGLEIMREILELADEKRIQLVGLWIPRALNQCADYLSHLAHLLHREHAQGTVQEGHPIIPTFDSLR